MNVLRIGRYRVLQHLGDGGSANVYLAEDTLLHRKVALKLLRLRDADARQSRTSFEREAQYASLLNHPNVVTVFDVGCDEDVQYIASEHVEGETLRERLRRGPMTMAEAVEVALGIASALVAAHEAWIVHRDIKPENVMLRPDGVVKVLDFGVAAIGADADANDPLRRPGGLVGTLHYLSPEQVRGEAIIDTRSDIYSLGVVLYEMLAGRPPFDAGSPMDTLAHIVEREPPPLPGLVPDELERIVERTMRKSIYDRPQTAAELVALLTEVRIDFMLRDRAARAAAMARA